MDYQNRGFETPVNKDLIGLQIAIKRIEELEEWIVSLLVDEACYFAPEMMSQERFDEVVRKLKNESN